MFPTVEQHGGHIEAAPSDNGHELLRPDAATVGRDQSLFTPITQAAKLRKAIMKAQTTAARLHQPYLLYASHLLSKRHLPRA
jgi:hypothetical protein